MGILSWWRGGSGSDGDKAANQSPQQQQAPPPPPPPPTPAEAPGMNGAQEVPRKPPTRAESKVTVFEFGSVAASADKVTLTGYCPVSDDLEPCRWEILPAAAADSPQFRVAF